jgi:hypothetical protein
VTTRSPCSTILRRVTSRSRGISPGFLIWATALSGPDSFLATTQVFASFDLQIAYDKAERRVELTATVSEAVADAFENAKALQMEGSSVVARDIAGAGFEPATSGL